MSSNRPCDGACRCARIGLSVVLALGGLVLAVLPAAAQMPLAFGAQVNYCDDADFGLGVRVQFDTAVVAPRTRLVASFDYYFPESTERNFDGIGVVEVEPSFWEINLNGHYAFALPTAPATLYAGTGLHIYDGSVDVSVPGTEVRGFDPDGSGIGLNVLGGVEFSLGPTVTPFAEMKIEIGGAEQVVLTAGVRF